MNTKKITALLLTSVLTVSALTGCGINKNETIATLTDGTTVSMGVANFLCRYEQATSDDVYRSYAGDEVWVSDLYGTGSTMQETVKSGMMDDIHEMYTLKAHMADYNVTISDEDKKAIADAATKFMAANSSSACKEMGATQEIVEEALTLYTIKQKMKDAIMADADTNVSDEEANMRAYTMLSVGIQGTYDSNYNYVAYTEDQIAALKGTVENVALEAGADPANFETIAENNGLSTTTGAYDKANESLDENVKTVLDGLKEGEISELISTDSTLYVVRLDSESDKEATEENKKTIVSKRQSDLYDETLSGWQENDGWNVKDKVLAKIQFDDFFTQETEEATESVDTTEAAAVTETVDATEAAE